jgi:hypothetical protein
VILLDVSALSDQIIKRGGHIVPPLACCVQFVRVGRPAYARQRHSLVEIAVNGKGAKLAFNSLVNTVTNSLRLHCPL